MSASFSVSNPCCSGRRGTIHTNQEDAENRRIERHSKDSIWYRRQRHGAYASAGAPERVTSENASRLRQRDGAAGEDDLREDLPGAEDDLPKDRHRLIGADLRIERVAELRVVYGEPREYHDDP